MTREGMLQDDVMKDGRYITVELYGIVNPGEVVRRLERSACVRADSLEAILGIPQHSRAIELRG